MATRSHWSTIAKAIQTKTGGTWKSAVQTYRDVRAERGTALSLHYLRTAPARAILTGVKATNQPKVTGQKPQPVKPKTKPFVTTPLPPIRDKWKPPTILQGNEWRKYKKHPLWKFVGTETSIGLPTTAALVVSLADTVIGRDLKKLPAVFTERMGKLMIKIGETLDARGFIPDTLRRKLAALIKAMGKKLNKAYTDNELYQGLKSFYG